MKKPTQAELLEVLSYDPSTGVFRRLRGGGACGSINSWGYVRIRVNGVVCKGHHLAWLYVTGEWPSQPIDHINGVRSDNRFANLRLATQAENRVNSVVRSDNASGLKGVSQRPSGRWRAQIRVDGAKVNLGTFDTAQEAGAAFQKAASETHGEFARHVSDPQ